MHLTVHAPGRVNLIGDHTDHTGGWVLPLAIDLGLTVEAERGGDLIDLGSDLSPDSARLPLTVPDPSMVEPSWARHVAALVSELAPVSGLTGRVRSTLPAGAGLASSAALSVATALALGATGDRVGIAELCRRAETRATGVPCGLMDQLACLGGVAGSALLIDTGSAEVTPVPVPPGAEIVVVHSGEQRALADSAYRSIRDRCVSGEAVAAVHVETENRRVLDAATALAGGDVAEVGRLMVDSHRSLARLGVSTAGLDRLVERLLAIEGVFGARLTGAGFGGCVVALCEPATFESHLVGSIGDRSPMWRVRPSDGARITMNG